MASNIMKSRFMQKCDTTENWQKAHDNGFIPLKGELIVYQDYDADNKPLAPKFKTGDGKTLVGDLIFATADIEIPEVGPIVSGAQEKSAIFEGDNPYVALSKNSIALGSNVLAGGNAFRYISMNIDQEARATVFLVENDVTNYFNLDTLCTIFTFSEYPSYDTPMSVTYDPVDNMTTIIFSGVAFDDSVIDLESDPYKQTIRIDGQPNYGNVEIGTAAVAFGIDTHAEGYASFATGRDNKALSAYAFAQGRDNIAYYCSHAEGRGNKALGAASHSEGGNTEALGTNAHSEGRGTKATGLYSHAEGENTQATNEAAHAEGYVAKATAHSAHAEGHTTIAGAIASHTEGIYTRTGNYKKGDVTAHTNTGIGAFAHAEGNATIARGNSSHAEGKVTFAEGGCSHAEGKNTTATGDVSHTEGDGTIAKGYASHAEGQNCQALGTHSHAEGHTCIADSRFSHASGLGSKTAGPNTQGNSKATGVDGQTVVGTYNIIDNTAKFVVGAGAKDTERANAFTTGKDANGYYLTVGNTKITEAQLIKILNLIDTIE